MRKFAAMSFSFAAAIFAAVLLPWDGWYLPAACVIAVLALAAALLRRKLPFDGRELLILCSLAFALAYYDVYQAVICRPVTDLCGDTRPFSAVVTGDPVETDRGAKVTVRLRPGVKAIYYSDRDAMALLPGQRISGTAFWQDASRIRENDITTFTARGVFVLLYAKNDPTVETGGEDSLLFLPQRAAHSVKEMIGRIWDDPVTESFLLAELMGDRSHISEENTAVISETGLAHLFAVSGLHCAFLVTLIGLLIPPSRRRLYSVICVAVLLFYMVMVGMTPSVVRACIMQIALLVAPVFRRDSDSLTSLGAALLVLLLVNPYAAGGISLQMSFAATLGLVLLSGKIHGFFTRLYRGKKRYVKHLVSLASANLSASLSVMVFTVPLTAYYFNIVTLISPLSNFLAVPLAGWNFMAGLVTVLLGFLWLPAARLTGWVNWGMVRAVLRIARALMHLPLHALYFSNRYLKYWLTYVYALLGVCLLMRGSRRRFFLAGLLAAASLALCIGLNSAEYRYGCHGGGCGTGRVRASLFRE